MTTIPLSELPERYTFVDPAGGKKGATNAVKKTRARQAIVTIAVDSIGRVFSLEAWADRLPTSRFIDKIFSTHDKWHPQVMGIEANAMQFLFAESVEMVSELKKKPLPIQPIFQPTTVDKLFRIRSILQPVVANRMLFLQDDQTELFTELSSFPLAQTMDLVDALASAIAMVPPRESRVEQDDERAEYLAYLRESDAPMEEILRVAEGR